MSKTDEATEKIIEEEVGKRRKKRARIFFAVFLFFFLASFLMGVLKTILKVLRRQEKQKIFVSSTRLFPSPLDMQIQIRNYLEEKFGSEFLSLLNIPKDVQIGERVLYKLRGGGSATRDDEKQRRASEALDKMLQDAFPGKKIENDPVVSSGLPYPRIIDIPGATVISNNDFMRNDALAPNFDFSVEWLAGYGIGPEDDYRRFIYIDFRDPKVKAVFDVAYESYFRGGTFYEETAKAFSGFQKKKHELIAESKKHPEWLMVKLVQYQDEDTEASIAAVKIVQ